MTYRRALASGLVVAVLVIAHATLGSPTERPLASVPRAAAHRTDHEDRRAQALDAALAYVQAAPALAARGPIGRRELLGELVTPKLLDRQMADVNLDVAAIESRLQTDSGDAVALGRLRWVETPMTATTSDRGPASVTVRVWSVGVLGAPMLDELPSVWRTFTLEVVATSGQWLIDAVRVEPGPAPIEAGIAVRPSTFADFERVASWPPALRRVK